MDGKLLVGRTLWGLRSMRLAECRNETEQARWAVEHLKKGGRIHDISLWLGGVDRPMRIIAEVKNILRAEGRKVTAAMETVRDAADGEHQVLVWRLA
jgi:hypothetical protein